MRNTNTYRWATSGRIFRSALAMLAAFMVITVAGCDGILDVEDPERATLEDIQDPENLPAMRAHAIGEFQVGYAGRGAAQDNSYILMSGLLTDEYEASGTFPTRVEVDRRDIGRTNATAQTTFRLMHRARAAAIRSFQAFEELDPGTLPQAEAAKLAGFMYNAFGEMYCSGVPFSELPPGEDPVFGEPTPTDEIFLIASDWFDQAQTLAQGAGSEPDELAAKVGQARSLVNLGRYEEAATLVSDVPTDFVFQIFHDDATPRQWNGMWNFLNNVKRWRVTDQAGGNGLPYRSDGTEMTAGGEVLREGDPRITWFEDGTGFDSSVQQYSQLRYASRSDPTPVATGIEARLIEAEAALDAGQTGVFQSIHDDLRASIGLGALETGGLSDEELVDLHFKERAYWLWQTGHRLGDLRRLVRQYNRDSEDVFPSGTYYKGGPISTDVNFPIPVDEDNNPNFEQCLNRDA